MLRPKTILLALALLAVFGASAWWFLGNRQGAADRGQRTVDVGELLGDGTGSAGFARALESRAFVFPRDHGAHPEFRNEWWYFTGNLRARDGRRFGYQLTVFRSALSPDVRGGTSSWATRQAYMGHLALSDASAGSFHYFQRFSRGAAGLAGAGHQGMSVWIEDWKVSAVGDGSWRLRAAAGEGEDAVALDLVLQPRKPVVLQGDRGLSRKGGEPGNASYYYSLTRIATSGTVATTRGRWSVQGGSWLDREWSTSVLAPGQVGWDWFAVQLDSGDELMYYRLRKRDGSTDRHSQGVWVDAAGNVRRLRASDVVVEARGEWTSAETGVRYPSGWRIRVPKLELSLDLDPLLDNQELDVLVRYWEGAVDVHGRAAGKASTGWGYVELTGYDRGG
jgi:predicted secreted hydrolase